MKRAWKGLLVLGLLIALLAVPHLAYSQLPGKQQATVKEVVTVNAVGTLHIEDTYTYPASYYTSSIAPDKVNPFMIPEVRFMRSGQSSKEIPKENIKVDFDDAHSSIKVTFDAMGFTRNTGDSWQLEVTPGATVAAQTANSLVLSSTSQKGQLTYLYTSTINFPKEAKQIKFDGSKITYVLPGDPPGFPTIYVAAAAVCAVLLVLNLRRKKGLI